MSTAIEDYIAHGAASLKNIRGVLVSVDGVTQLALYRVGSPDDRAHVFSVTKSVLSTLVGIALRDRILGGLQEDLGALLPQYKSDMSSAVASITLDQVLTMTSGLPERTPDE